MIRVTINDIDFLEEYGLYLIDREIGVATPNLYQTTVPGRNGKLDLTDFYGDVTFQNRWQRYLSVMMKIITGTEDWLLNLMMMIPKSIK